MASLGCTGALLCRVWGQNSGLFVLRNPLLELLLFLVVVCLVVVSILSQNEREKLIDGLVGLGLGVLDGLFLVDVGRLQHFRGDVAVQRILLVRILEYVEQPLQAVPHLFGRAPIASDFVAEAAAAVLAELAVVDLCDKLDLRS